MKKISQLSILLLGLFLALPLSAKWHTDIQELEEALKCFINDKSVSLSDPVNGTHQECILLLLLR